MKGELQDSQPKAYDPLLDELENLARHVEDQVQTWKLELSSEQLLWSPAPNKWGVGQCLKHLYDTGEQYLPRIQVALDAAAEYRSPWKPSLTGRLLNRAVDPTSKRKLKSPSRFAAKADQATASTPDQFLGQQAELLVLIAAARGRDLRRPRLKSPISGLIRLNVGDAIKMLVQHQRRHLAQAGRVIEAPGFPKRSSTNQG